MSDQIRSPWAIYTPQGELAYLSLHTSHIDAWVGYLGILPYGALMHKQNEGWRAERVRIEPMDNIVPLRPGCPTPRDVLSVAEGGPQ